jgi:F-type H+-transporting ATPase subunit alpha
VVQIKPEEISSIIEQRIRSYTKTLDLQDVGTILEVGDGIARIHGLNNAMAGELLEFPEETLAWC